MLMSNNIAIDSKKIDFRLATLADLSLIDAWWHKSHVAEFWDNSPSMWQNVIDYLHGKKNLFDYWIGSIDGMPFSLLMTSEIDKILPPDDPYANWIDPHGLTMSIDFMIGEEQFLGKGLGSLTLKQFAELLKHDGVTTLIIDPAENNPRARHVYQKAGFSVVGTFDRLKGYFEGKKHYLMVMRLENK